MCFGSTRCQYSKGVTSSPRVRETSLVDESRRSATARDRSGRQVMDQVAETNIDSLRITNMQRNSADFADEDNQEAAVKPAATEQLTTHLVVELNMSPLRRLSNYSL